MDYDLANYAGQMNPLQQQMLMANLLRKQGRSESQQRLADEFAKSRRFDELAAVSQLINNPAAVEAAQAAQRSAGAGKPQQLGAQGFVLPSSGEFIESPIYEDEKKAQRDAMLEGRRMQIEAQADRAREGNYLKETLADLAERGRNERASDRNFLLSSIAAMKDQTANRKIDNAAGGKAKTLGASEVRKLQDQEGIAFNFGEIANGFQDGFAGTPALAGLQNTLGKYGVDKYAKQSNWWQNYNEQKNLIRNKLFGSALTATEKAAFDAANISEGMDPEVIRTRLNQQHAASVRAYNKLKMAFDKAGYDMSQFEDMMEPPKPAPGAGKTPAGAPPSGPKRIKYDAQGNEITQ